jgi:hypothetical protein
MAVSEMCSTLDAIRAFLEHFVDPMLQEKPSISDDPSLSLQQKVAKQVFFPSFILKFLLLQ